jgi:hypothetical protein
MNITIVTAINHHKNCLVVVLTILKKYHFVNGKDDIPYEMENKIHVPNHQPVKEGGLRWCPQSPYDDRDGITKFACQNHPSNSSVHLKKMPQLNMMRHPKQHQTTNHSSLHNIY